VTVALPTIADFPVCSSPRAVRSFPPPSGEYLCLFLGSYFLGQFQHSQLLPQEFYVPPFSDDGCFIVDQILLGPSEPGADSVEAGFPIFRGRHRSPPSSESSLLIMWAR